MSVSRRQFLKTGALVGGGLVVGFSLGGCSKPPLPNAREGVFQPNAFLQIAPDNTITVQIHKAEMGQGVTTGLPTLIAEELEVDPTVLVLEFAGIHPDFKDPAFTLMITGGSTSIANNYTLLREVGATAREMLLAAASQRFQLPREQLVAENGVVRSLDGSKQATYGELSQLASTLKAPEKVTLKEPGAFKLIGKFDRRLDARAKVNGTAQFSLDVMPEALKAVIVRCPHLGGRATGFDDKQARQMPGVVDIFQMDTGIAVVADTYWHARKAAEKLQVSWDKGPMAGIGSEEILAEFRRLTQEGEAAVVREEGENAPGTVEKTLEAEYFAPFLAHATMEPPNAVVSVTDKECLVWAGNQGPDLTQALVAKAIDKPREFVRVQNTYLGGGFGRRVVADYIVEAAIISNRLRKPVHVVWSREDDIRHDYYRPATLGTLRAELTADGRVHRWNHRLVGPSINAKLMPLIAGASMPAWAPQMLLDSIGGFVEKEDFAAVEGAKEIPYGFDNIKVDYVAWNPGVPLGYWRSVGHSHTAFVVESFMDEVAHALGKNPLEFRLAHLAKDSRQHAALSLAAEKAGWGKPSWGNFQGLAVHESFGTVVAQVAEVSVSGGSIRVHRVVCAVDCGQVVNPDIVRAQMESGILFGLTAALKGEITLKDGAVVQGNFHDYPVLRMNETPEIEIHFVASSNPPSGVGEPATPPIAAAVANAVFVATGQRLRSLPLRPA